MKRIILAIALVLSLLFSYHTVYADVINYTQILKKWGAVILPGKTLTFSIEQVGEFKTEKNDQPPDSFFMFLYVGYEGKKDKFIIIANPQFGVYAYKKIDLILDLPQQMQPQPDKKYNPLDGKHDGDEEAPQQDQGPQCSPEEHDQHHGNGQKQL